MERLLRSPIRRGGVDLNDRSLRIGCTFFGSFLCASKERDKGKNAVKGKFRDTEKVLICTISSLQSINYTIIQPDNNESA
jgi:hypothetical protein